MEISNISKNILKDVNEGMDAYDICHKYKISYETFHDRLVRYSGMDGVDVIRLIVLEEENQRLIRLLARNKRMAQMLSKKISTQNEDSHNVHIFAT